MNFIKSLKSRRVVLAAVAVVIVAIVAAVVFLRMNALETGVAEDQQLVAVRRGDLIDQVSVSGTVSFPERENMTFGSDGVIEDVLVTEGKRVSAGDTLATLDAETVARLEREVTEARVSLRDAEKALEDFLEPASNLSVAQAEQKVVDAEAALENAQDALDAIVSPDHLAIEDMNAKVAAAAKNARDAEKALSDVTLPDTLAVADMESKVAAAAKNVRDAEKALEDALDPSALAMAQAEKNALDAEKALEDLLAQPTELQIAQAENKVAKAMSAVADAGDALKDYMERNDPDKLEDARRAVSEAETNLANLNADYRATRSEWDSRMDAAQTALDDAGEAYADTFYDWLGVIRPASEWNPDYADALDEIGVDLAALYDEANNADVLGNRGTLPADDPATAWNETHVAIWTSFGLTDLTPTCEPDDLPAAGVCIEQAFRETSEAYQNALDGKARSDADEAKSIAAAQSAIDAADNALDKAKDALEELEKPDDAAKIAELESAIEIADELLAEALTEQADLIGEGEPLAAERKQAEIEVARANLEDAEKKLADLNADAETIAHLRAQLELASATHEDAMEKLYELNNPAEANAEMVANLVAQADLAGASLEDAEEKLEELLSGEDHPDYESASQAVEVARFTVEERQDDLNELLKAPDAIDRDKLQAQVDAAKTQLSESEERLADASLKAPWDGFVSRVDVEAGKDVKATDIVAVLVDTSVVEVDGSVDEVDVLKIQLDNAAVVEVDALEDRKLGGAISFIGAEANQQNQGGVVSYPVKVRLTLPDDVELPAGLSAVASITIREARDALLVPVNAVRGAFDAPILNVMADGEVVERRVQLGIADDFWTVVTRGVQEGEMVVAQAPEGGALDVTFDMEGGPPDENEGPPPGERRRRPQNN